LAEDIEARVERLKTERNDLRLWLQTRTPAIGRDAANEADRKRDRLRHVERELAQANVELGQHRKARAQGL
jgi:hypothetical protein